MCNMLLLFFAGRGKPSKEADECSNYGAQKTRRNWKAGGRLAGSRHEGRQAGRQATTTASHATNKRKKMN